MINEGPLLSVLQKFDSDHSTESLQSTAENGINCYLYMFCLTNVAGQAYLKDTFSLQRTLGAAQILLPSRLVSI